jgi:hypothetical protein
MLPGSRQSEALWMSAWLMGLSVSFFAAFGWFEEGAAGCFDGVASTGAVAGWGGVAESLGVCGWVADAGGAGCSGSVPGCAGWGVAGD